MICGTTHKTVKRVIEAQNAGGAGVVGKQPRARNYDEVADLVAKRVKTRHLGPNLGEAVAGSA